MLNTYARMAENAGDEESGTRSCGAALSGRVHLLAQGTNRNSWIAKPVLANETQLPDTKGH